MASQEAFTPCHPKGHWQCTLQSSLFHAQLLSSSPFWRALVEPRLIKIWSQACRCILIGNSNFDHLQLASLPSVSIRSRSFLLHEARSCMLHHYLQDNNFHLLTFCFNNSYFLRLERLCIYWIFLCFILPTPVTDWQGCEVWIGTWGIGNLIPMASACKALRSFGIGPWEMRNRRVNDLVWLGTHCPVSRFTPD